MAKSKSNSDSSERLTALERRLADAEDKLSLLWSSSLGHELRGLEHSRRQRRIDREDDRAREERRSAAAGDRATVFGRFAGEKLAVHASLDVTAAKLMQIFNDWCRDNQEPRLHWVESDAELQAAIAGVFPDVQVGDVQPEGYLGGPGYVEKGYRGIALVPDGQTPAEYTEQLRAETTQKRAARVASRELEEVLHPTPTQPPPAFRKPARLGEGVPAGAD